MPTLSLVAPIGCHESCLNEGVEGQVSALALAGIL